MKCGERIGKDYLNPLIGMRTEEEQEEGETTETIPYDDTETWQTAWDIVFIPSEGFVMAIPGELDELIILYCISLYYIVYYKTIRRYSYAQPKSPLIPNPRICPY